MEKMLDKKSRDFAKNMRDTMIYDKSKNEVQIGTNLYVNGQIKSSILEVNELYTSSMELYGGFDAEEQCSAPSFLQNPTFTTIPVFLDINSLPTESGKKSFNVKFEKEVTFLNFKNVTLPFEIDVGNALILIDPRIDITNTFASLSSTPGANNNFATFKANLGNKKFAIIILHGAVYITGEYQF